MPEAIWCTTKRPDNVGGLLHGSTYAWKSVYDVGLNVGLREARPKREARC